MDFLLKAGVILGLLSGTVFSCHRRDLRRQLVDLASSRYRHYAGSQDVMTRQECTVRKMEAPEDLRAVNQLGNNSPYKRPSYRRILGLCRMDFSFQNYPVAGKSSRVRVEMRYVWAGKEFGWEPL